MKNLDQISAEELISALLMRFPDSFAEAGVKRGEIRQALADFDPESNELASSILETMRLLRLRAGQLKVSDLPTEVQEVNGDASQAPTEQLPPADVPEEMPQAADEVANEVTQPLPHKIPGRWTDRERLLYRDIIHLFELGDHGGAMASLERLFMLCPDATELSTFLGKNEATLLRLYRDQMGTMDRVTIPSRSRKPIRIPTPDADLMLKLIRMSDGHRPIRDFVKKAESPELHVLLTLSHLVRSGYLELA